MKTQLQLIATTIALTILIWVYADQSGYENYQTTVLVRYVPPADPESPFIVRVHEAKGDVKDALRVELEVRGPRSAIRRLEKDDASGRFGLTVVLAGELKTGVQTTRDAAEDISRLAEIRNRGLTLQSVHPRNAQLEIDRYRNVPVSVEVAASSFEKVLDGPIIVRPDKVTARVLESRLPALGPSPVLKLSIDEALQNRAEQASEQFAFDVALHSTWNGVEATFTPDHVRVSGRLGRPSTSERITLIPLGVLVEPQNFFGKYEIEWQDPAGAQFQTVSVRVPLVKANQLKGNAIDAYLTIKDSDLPKDLPVVSSAPATQESWIEREIRFVFPTGFEDVKLEGPPRMVKFRIRKLTDLAATKSSTGLPVLPVHSP